MRLTEEEVRHIALLARIGMTEDEIERMRDQMSNILDHFDVLQLVDTDGVEPTGHSADLESVLRDDEAEASRPIEDILANAPQRESDFIKVKAVLD